jgi:hypothetical protein
MSKQTKRPAPDGIYGKDEFSRKRREKFMQEVLRMIEEELIPSRPALPEQTPAKRRS